MSNMYQNKKAGNPIVVVIGCLIIGLILIVAFDYGLKKYYDMKIDSDCKKAATEFINKETLINYEDRVKYLRSLLPDYNKNDIVLTEKDTTYYISLYKKSDSVINSIFGKGKYTSSANYKVYINEYSEPVVEKISDDEEKLWADFYENKKKDEEEREILIQ